MANVRIWWDTQVQAYRLTTPYHQPFLEALKALIPYSDRSYDKETRIWTLTERYFKPVKELCETIWPSAVTTVTKEQAQSAQSPKSVTLIKIDEVIVQFFRMLPPDAAAKAYRHAAMLMHPDRGGDMESMSKLNALWQRLETELFNKNKQQ